MTDIQEQVLIGAVWGGSSLVKQPRGRNYYLTMRSKDPTWLHYKIAELCNYFTSSELTKQYSTYRCSSVCSNEFTECYERLYCNGKRCITEPVLEGMRDIGLAIWFLEGGGWAGRDRKNAYINTTLLRENTPLALDYFNSLGMTCALNKTKGRQKILFSVPGTKKLFRVIAPRFPNFVCERLK